MNASRFFLLVIAFLLVPVYGHCQRVFKCPELLDKEIGMERTVVLKDFKFPLVYTDTILRGNGTDTIRLVFKQNILQAFLFYRSFDSTQLNAATILLNRLEKRMSRKYKFIDSYFDAAGANPPFYMVKGRGGLTKDRDKKQFQCDIILWRGYADGRYTLVMYVMP